MKKKLICGLIVFSVLIGSDMIFDDNICAYAKTIIDGDEKSENTSPVLHNVEYTFNESSKTITITGMIDNSESLCIELSNEYSVIVQPNAEDSFKNLKSVNIKAGNITLSDNAFANCNNLKKVKLEGKTIIKSNTFSGCILDNLTVTNDINNIKGPSSVSTLTSNALSNLCGNVNLAYCYIETNQNVNKKIKLTTWDCYLDYKCFENSLELEDVSIGGGGCIGDFAFKGCSNTTINFGACDDRLKNSIGRGIGNIYYACGEAVFSGVKYVGPIPSAVRGFYKTFDGYDKPIYITNISDVDKTESYGQYSKNITDCLEAAGKKYYTVTRKCNGFYGYSKDDMFVITGYCGPISNINTPTNIEESKIEFSNDFKFNNLVPLGNVTIDSTISELPECMFEGTDVVGTLKLPDNIKIGDKCFYNCNWLPKHIDGLIKPDTIGTQAFYGTGIGLDKMSLEFTKKLYSNSLDGISGITEVNLLNKDISDCLVSQGSGVKVKVNISEDQLEKINIFSDDFGIGNNYIVESEYAKSCLVSKGIPKDRITVSYNYKYTFKDCNGVAKTICKFDKLDNILSQAPKASECPQYVFDKWEINDSNCKDVIITAKYKEVVAKDNINEPQIEANKYAVRFLNDDGTLIKEQEVEKGQSAEAPSCPEKKGYIFKGWDKDFSNVTSNIEVKAIFEKNAELGKTDKTEETSGTVTPSREEGDDEPTTPTTKKYTVKFLNEDGTQIGEVQEVEEGKAALAPAKPTKEGYKFKGWDKDFSNVTSNIEVKAMFEKNAELGKIDKTEELSSTVTPPREEGGNEPTTPIIKKYIVKFLNEDGTQIGEVQEIEEGKAALAPENPIKEGYTFKGWDKKFDNIIEDTVITPIYAKNNNDINLNNSSEDRDNPEGSLHDKDQLNVIEKQDEGSKDNTHSSASEGNSTSTNTQQKPSDFSDKNDTNKNTYDGNNILVLFSMVVGLLGTISFNKIRKY